MAKRNVGGKRATSGNWSAGLSNKAIQAQQTTDANTQVDTTTQAGDFGESYEDFLKMTEDQKADAIEKAIAQPIPSHLSDTDFQRMLYNLDFNDKPDLVADAKLDAMNGTELFRTVNNVYDSANDLHYSPTDIAKQIQRGTTTRTSDTGGSMYGRGIYFADSYRGSAGYGNYYDDITKTAIVRAKLNSNAKVINYYTASSGASREISNGTKLGKLLSKCDSASRPSIYAVVKGYNVINDTGYYNVLNRKAITMSKDVKATSSKGW